MDANRGRVGRWVRTLAFGLVLAALPAVRVQAQMFGYGGFGSYPGYAYGGYGYPGYGFGGYGYPGYGFGGYGFGGYGFGPYGYGGAYYGGFGYNSPAAFYGSVFPAYGYGNGFGYGGYPYMRSYTASGAPYVNPLFGLGLTPIGVNSALTERYVLGRGTSSYYSRSYAPIPRAGR